MDIARQQAMMRSANKRITVMVIVFFGALLGIIPLGNYIERHEELFWLDKILAPILLGTSFTIWMLLLAYVAPSSAVWTLLPALWKADLEFTACHRSRQLRVLRRKTL